MPRLVTGAAVLLGAVALWLWGMGGADQLMRWATAAQSDVQTAMAGYLQRLRTGDMSALIGLWSVCFAYGFFHAAGPGHGKILIGGYGVATRVPVVRLSLLAVLSSLAQALTAIVLVYAGVWLLGLTRAALTDTADRWLAPVSYGAIALVGAWLVLRGIRRWRRQGGAGHSKAGHSEDVCGSCGHRHGPSAEEAAGVTSLRDGVAIVGAVAMRPCTGALFLLILTVRFGLEWAGILGAFFIGLGTASVTVIVALAAVTFREGIVNTLTRDGAISRSVPLVEMAAGAVVVIVSLQLMLGAL